MPPHNISNVCVRFAPSPTGFMHLGSLRTALYNYLFAKKYDGTFFLRIEDTDQSRCVPSALHSIVDTLRWTGLNFDVGPIHQSARIKLYNDKILELIDKKVAYRCFCSQHRLELLRKEAAKNRANPRYDRRCLSLSKSEIEENLYKKIPHTIRFKLEDKDVMFNDMISGRHVRNVFLSESDPIILKSDGFPTYHFANVVDDNDMKITHVFRGAEWLGSTALHIMLYHAFGWKAPEFAHLPLIINKDGSKLSKRNEGFRVDYLRESGYSPKAILNYLRSVGGGFRNLKIDSVYKLEDLISSFDPQCIVDHPAKLDFERLDFYNNKIIKEQIGSNVTSLVETLRLLIEKSFGQNIASQFTDEYLKFVDRIKTINDLITKFSFLWHDPVINDTFPSYTSLGSLSEIIKNSCKIIEQNGSKQELSSKSLKEYCDNNDIPYNKYMRFIRLALTGLKEGPPVAEILTLLGAEKSCERLKKVLNIIQEAHEMKLKT